nr:ATP-binding cassette domain-containing protein [Candidatus Omnitrophota bacterium]
MEMPVFRVEELKVRIGGRYVIDEVSFDIHGGEVLALVGESGSGKTLTGLAAMDLLPESSCREKGRIFLEGTDIFTLRKEAKRRIRGKEISMVFQEPFTAMNPVMRVGSQIQEALDAHFDMPRADSSKLICDIIRSVRLDQVVLNS